MNKENKDFDSLKKENLSLDELCVIGACMGYLSAPNISATILDCPGHMLRKRIIELLESLESKDYVKCSFDKRPIVDKRIGQLATTVCDPDQIAFFKWSRSGRKCHTATIYMKNGHYAVIDEEGSIFHADQAGSVIESLSKRIGIAAFETYFGEGFSLLFDELRYAKKMADSFQPRQAEIFLSKCMEQTESLTMLMKVVSGSTGYITMNRWQKKTCFFTMVNSDYIAVVDNQLIHIRNFSDGSIKFRGTSPEKLDVRIKEYCDMAGDKK